MTILVTGATGSLGPRIVERLLGEGRAVRVLTRRPFACDRLFAKRVEMVEWHPGSEPFPVACLTGVDQVIHLMGAPYAGSASKAHLAAIHRSRLHVMQRLVAALADRRLRLVMASVAVPPAVASSGEPVSDASLFDGVCPPGLHADVGALEAVALDARARGLTVAVMRMGLLLSPGAVWTLLVSLAERGLAPPLAGSIIPAIDPDDAATMLTGLLARAELEGVFHGVAPMPLTGVGVLALLRPLRRVPLSCPIPRLVAKRWLGLLTPVLLGKAPLTPQRLVDAGARFAHPDPLPRLETLVAEMTAQRRAARAWRIMGRRNDPRQPTPVSGPKDPTSSQNVAT